MDTNAIEPHANVTNLPLEPAPTTTTVWAAMPAKTTVAFPHAKTTVSVDLVLNARVVSAKPMPTEPVQPTQIAKVASTVTTNAAEPIVLVQVIASLASIATPSFVNVIRYPKEPASTITTVRTTTAVTTGNVVLHAPRTDTVGTNTIAPTANARQLPQKHAPKTPIVVAVSSATTNAAAPIASVLATANLAITVTPNYVNAIS